MTIEEEKKLFAAYLNMARHNAFITLSHIGALLGCNAGSENRLAEMWPVTLPARAASSSEEVAQAIKLLNEYFPFLKPMLDVELQRAKKEHKLEQTPIATPGMYHTILTKCFAELNRQRNRYTHARHEEKPFDKELIYYMKNSFDGAVRVVKERFNLQDRDVAHLNRYREKPEAAYDEKGRRKKEYEENPKFHYKFDDNSGNVTIKGLAFFTCLFLERKYAGLLLSQLEGFKRSGQKGVEESTRATRNVFSIYNIRIPKLRIDSESSTMTLGIDMLNELKKCPAKLFEHLDAKMQERFRVSANAEQPDDEAQENLTLLRRFENRFPQLALSYIDRQKLFSHIRFQVALGAYRYKFYDKQGVDQKERVRILQKKLHGFGRLQEIEDLRKKEWAALIRPFEDTEKDHAGSKPYITDTHAQYMISNNRVGMYWKVGREKDPGDCLPVLKENGAENQAPVCWLSIYELPALIFHSLLCEDQNATQAIICCYVNRYRMLFSAIQTGELLPSPDAAHIVQEQYNVKFAQLPDEIRAYLSGKEKDMATKFAELASVRIARMVQHTQRRKQKIERDIATIQDKKKNKVGKKRHVEIKSGYLADFLAEDLMQLQPTQVAGKDKLTGANYQTLQATLAYYGEHKAEMKQIFAACKLLDSPIAHPFLDKVMEKTHSDIVSFYKSYLDEREKYLSKCLREKDYKRYHFLHANRDKWQQRSPEYYRQLAEKYLALPVELPRGLFNNDVKKLLDTPKYNRNPEIKEALSPKKRCNTVYLIQTYFKAVSDDGKQEFYDFPRSYKLFDTLDDKIVHNKLQQTFRTTAELEKRLRNIAVEIDLHAEKQYQKEKKQLQDRNRFRELKKLEAEKNSKAIQTHSKLIRLLNEFEQNEKILRLTRVQDMLLFLMAKHLLIESRLPEAVLEKYKLKDIKPGSETDILSVQTPFSLPVKFSDGGKTRTVVIRQEQLKLKNFGNFYRLIRDRRVNTLLPHFPDGTADRLTLEQ